MKSLQDIVGPQTTNVDLEAVNAIAKNFYNEKIGAVVAVVDAYKGKYAQELKLKAMDAIIERARSAPNEMLDAALAHPAYSDWAKAIMMSERARRGIESQKAMQEALLEKEERKIIVNRKATGNVYKGRLLPNEPEYECIFKTKWQFWKPVMTKKYGLVRWIQSEYSRDYPSERKYFDKENLRDTSNRIAEKGGDAYKLFDRGGIFEGGFNGYTEGMKMLERFKKKETPDICCFGIYLTFVQEQQSNGEFYSMELFRWGNFLPQKVEQ